MLHAAWSGGRLHLWGESSRREAEWERDGGAPEGDAHPWAADGAFLRELLPAGAPWAARAEAGELTLRLPDAGRGPALSPKMAHWVGHDRFEDGEFDGGAGALGAWRVETVSFDPGDALRALTWVEEAGADAEEHVLDEASGHETERARRVMGGETVRYFATGARFAQSLLGEQRFVPSVVQTVEGDVRGAWEPWLGDDAVSERAALLVGGMPPAARAVDDAHAGEPAEVLRTYLSSIVDAACRRALGDEEMIEALEDWDTGSDPHAGWLAGLLDEADGVPLPETSRVDLVRCVRRWIGGLEERGSGTAWRLCFQLNEPLLPEQSGGFDAAEDAEWDVSLHLQSLENERLLIDAEDIWSLRGDTASVGGQRVDGPRELMLAEMGRGSRLWPALEGALEDGAPGAIPMTTRAAYEFLREIGPLLADQGFGVIAPEWWDSPSGRLGARLQLTSTDAPDRQASGGGPTAAGDASLGLNALVSYEWRLAVGETPLTLEEFERLAQMRAPLVRIDGRWVEIRREDIDHALRFMRENPGGDMRVGDALLMAYASDSGATGVPILGVDATGWVAELLGAGEGDGGAPEAFRLLEPPGGFHGELRPYQLKGVSWLAFLDRVGLGPCLADDMGLGKTIQLLALLVHERERAEASGGATPKPDPTLIVVPMSIVGNWVREAARFAPSLRVLVHHGPERLAGDEFSARASSSDIVVTTYALAHRDRELLECVRWGRVVLDEAQNIKNPSAKQSQAVRGLDSPRRVALTGTPLENRLSELWSIIDFCNPGYLGSAGEFRRTFGVPVERYRDKGRAAQLRNLVRPFILRRLKTDPTVISDLPEKVETKEMCRLTSEQVTLYESCVRTMLGEVDRSEGIRRRGVVLTALIRLKQICNHPALVMGDSPAPELAGAAFEPGAVEEAGAAGGHADASRSGKCIRLLEMLDEVIASGESALVFTQFRQMGKLLAGMLRHVFDREVLFLHGGHAPEAARGDDRALPAGRRDHPGLHPLAQGRRRRAQPHRRVPRLPLRPLVEPGRREPGHRPSLPHRPEAHRQRPQVRRRRHARGPHRPDDREQDRARRGRHRLRRGVAHRAQRRAAPRRPRPPPRGPHRRLRPERNTPPVPDAYHKRPAKDAGKPRRVRGGLRLAEADWPERLGPTGAALLDAMAPLAPPEAWTAGLEHAFKGQTRAFDPVVGGVDAAVQGAAYRAHEVTVRVGTLGDDDWKRLVEALVERPRYGAKLLAGEMPEDIGELFASLSLELVPPDGGAYAATINGRELAAWDEFVCCAALLLADAVDREPMSVFALRGMRAEDLLERVRQRRDATSAGEGRVSSVVRQYFPGSERQTRPLEACADRFWDAGPELELVETPLRRPDIRHALLRRLGPSPFTDGKFPLVGLLATCYETIGESALRAGEPEDGQPDADAG